MTETLHFKDVLVGYTSITNTPIHYVSYTTPSPEDRNWSLTFYAHQFPHRDKPTHYFRCYEFIDDDQAKQDYPLFRELAMERNWGPMPEIPEPDPEPSPPCDHSHVRYVKLSSITKKLAYHCHDCGEMVGLFRG